MNVSLRELRGDDASWLDGWLGACAASVGYGAIDQAAAAPSLFKRLESDDVRACVIVAAEDVGIVTYRAATPATIEFVGVQPAHARCGYGHAGATLVEGILQAAGARTIYAPAPAVHGIAVYFWIRLGYRPLLQGEWPRACTEVAWFRRDLSSIDEADSV